MAMTIVLEGADLMAFAEALKAEFPEFEVDFETGAVRKDALDQVEKVVVRLSAIALLSMPTINAIDKTVDVAGKAIDVAGDAVELVDQSIDVADKFAEFIERWNKKVNKAVLVPDEGDRVVLSDTSMKAVFVEARSIG